MKNGNWVLLAALVFAVTAMPLQGSTQWPNEPEGSILLSDEPFNAGSWPCERCTDNAGWIDQYNNAVVVSNPLGLTTPRGSAPYAVQFTERVGQPPDCGPGNVWKTTKTQGPAIYVGIWFMLDRNFASSAGIKFFELFQSDNTMNLIPTLNPGGSAGLMQTFYLPNAEPINNCQVPTAQGHCPGTVNTYSNAAPNFRVSVGQWHQWELYIRLSTSTTSQNGIIRIWIDNTLVINYTNVNTKQAPFVQSMISNTYHGTPDQNYTLWYDHVRVCDASNAKPVSASNGQNPTVLAVSGSQLTAQPTKEGVLFRLAQDGTYSLEVCDLSGREIWKHSGTGEAMWSHGRNLQKGIYMIQAKQNGKMYSSRFCNVQ